VTAETADTLPPLARLPRVQAALNFVVDTGEKPVNIPSQPGGDAGINLGSYATHLVAIHDARPLAGGLSLDREGFALAHAETAMTDFFDPDKVREVYNPKIERLVCAATGARRAVVFDHTLRADSESTRREKKVREPVQRVHNDYTVRSGPQRVRDLFPPAEAEALLLHRFAIVNVWRSIRGAVETMPLALCDARTVAPGDLVASERRARDRVGETYRVQFNPAQRWFYFPHLRMDEAVLIKSYDAATDGRARFAPHTAFEDPNTPASAAPRQSMESRLFAFF